MPITLDSVASGLRPPSTPPMERAGFYTLSNVSDYQKIAKYFKNYCNQNVAKAGIYSELLQTGRAVLGTSALRVQSYKISPELTNI